MKNPCREILLGTHTAPRRSVSPDECIRRFDNSPKIMEDLEAFENVHLSQRRSSWWFCGHSSAEEIKMALSNAEYAHSQPGNQFGTYGVRLKAMISVYRECLGLKE